MTREKQFWIDFAEGRISVPEMLEYTKQDESLLNWFNDIVPEGKTITIAHVHPTEFGYDDYVLEDIPYTIQTDIREQIEKGHGGMLGRYLNIHHNLSRLLIEAFPDDGIVMDETLNEKFCFMLDACPEAVSGIEVESVLEDLMASLPADLSKSKRIKLFKEKLKELFPTAAGKWPRWVQDGEWPLGSGGKPMRFVKQQRKKGKEYAETLYTQYFFEDVDSGEVRIIDQFT